MSLLVLATAVAVLALSAGLAPRAWAASGDVIDFESLPGLTTDRDTVTQVAAGPDGSVYVAGIMDQAAVSVSLVVAKYDAARNLSWRKSYRPPGMVSANAYALAVDRWGDVVVVGETSDAVDSDLLVTKWSGANGALLWSVVRDGGGGMNDYGDAVAVARNGSVYVCGGIDDSRNAVVLNYARDADPAAPGAGLERWRHLVRSAAPDPEAWVGAIALDRSGNAYATGGRRTASHKEDMFVLKLSATGARRWLRAWDGAAHKDDTGARVALSGKGVYVAVETSPTTLTRNLALIKYDASGQRKWTRIWKTSRQARDGVAGLGCDARGNAYLAAAMWPSPTTQSAAVSKYSAAGKRLWQRRYKGASGGGGAYVSELVVGSTGNAWITGTLFQSGSVAQVYAVKFSPGGKRRWVTRWSGPVADPLGGQAWAAALTGTRDLTLVGEVATPGIGRIGSVLWLQR